MDPKVGRTVVLAVACSCLALFGTATAQQQGGGQGAQQPGGQGAQQPQQQQGGQPQSNQGKGGASSGATSKSEKAAPVAGKIKLGATVIETEAVAKGYRASKLIGSTVKYDQGERVGKIEDLIVSPDGKVSMAVVEVGGFLEIGERRVAIPVEQFTSLSPDVVLPGATKTALRNLPQFQYARA